MSDQVRPNSTVLEFLKFVEGQPRLSPEVLLGRILKKSRDLSGAEAGTIFLVRRGGTERWLEPACVQNDCVRVRRGDFVVPIGPGTIAGYVASSGETVIADDVYNLPASAPYQFSQANERHDYRTHSMLAFPLENDEGKAIGVVQLINRRVAGTSHPVPFDSSTVDLVVPVAAILGNLIERAELVSKIAAKNAALRVRNRELADSRKAIVELQAETEDAFMVSIRLLARAAEIHDEDTGNHIIRVNEYSHHLARLIGQADEFCKEIRYSAQLHDVGKMSVDAAVLKKRGLLNPEERAEMNKHPGYGYQILSVSGRLSMAAEIALNHHEKWDGTGYPNGKKAEEIPLSARIVQVADIYDALRSARPYKPSFSHEKASTIMLEGDSRIDPRSHFDPGLLDVFRSHHAEFDTIWQSLMD